MIEGIIVALIIVWLVTSIFRKAIDAVIWCAMFLLLIQIGYLLSFTSLNDSIPLSNVFRYDAFGALAQLFPGTPIADFFIRASNFLVQILDGFVSSSSQIWEMFHLEHIWQVLKDAVDKMPIDI